MREALGSIPSVSKIIFGALPTASRDPQGFRWLAAVCRSRWLRHHCVLRFFLIIVWAHGVAVSHPLSMREALGSIPSVSKNFLLGYQASRMPCRDFDGSLHSITTLVRCLRHRYMRAANTPTAARNPSNKHPERIVQWSYSSAGQSVTLITSRSSAQA